jgi:hypothetical protein
LKKAKKLPQKTPILLPHFLFSLAFKHEPCTLCEENSPHGALHAHRTDQHG